MMTSPGGEKYRIGIIGVGNPLMADEGVGPAVIEALEKRELHDCVELVDAGSAGMSLLHILKDYNAVILVDAADWGGEPGEVRAFAPDEVESTKMMRRESLHEADLMQVIELSRSLGELPDPLVVVGVQFGKVEFNATMTEPVREAVPKVVDLILGKVAEFIVKAE